MNLNESNFNVHSIAASTSASIRFTITTTTATIVHGPNNATQRQPGRNSAFELPLWLILCYSVILVCAIVGNLLVISVLVQNRRMRTITNVFLLNLAISDILLGVLCMPVTLVGTLLRQFIFGEFFCKLIQFSQAASVAISSWTLVAISCERYYAICHPLSSRRWQTHSHAYKIIACIWLGSMLCMLPIALFSQLMPTSRPGMHKCRENWPQYALPYERSYNLFLDLVLLVLPLLILSVAYILITRTLYAGMRMEKATIFGGKQENKHIPLHRKTFASNLLRKSSFYSTPSLSANAASSSSLTSRYKFNLSMGCPNAITKTDSFNNISSFAASNLPENHTKEAELPQQQQQQQRQHYKHQSQYQRLCQQPEHQIVFREANNQQPHEHFQQQQQQPCCEPFLRLCCKSSLNSNTGRPHLYCMRFATLKTTLPDKEGIAMSNFCKGDCCSGLGSTHTLNVNGNSHSNLTPTTIILSKSTSGLTTTAAATTMYCYQLQHQQPTCNYMVQQQQQTLPPSTNAIKHFNRKSLKITESVLRRSNITKNWECKKRVIKMLFVLVLEFFICWTPLYVINTLAMYIGTAIYEYIDYTSISVLQLLAYSSSCCNPITYCFMNANFRRAFWDTFKNMRWCSKWFQRKHSTAQSGGNLCLAGSIRVNSCTIQTVIDSPRL